MALALLYDNQEKLDENVSRIQSIEEARRNQPRSALPTWKGSPSEFHEFVRKIKEAVKHKPESAKQTDLLASISGPEKAAITGLFKH